MPQMLQRLVALTLVFCLLVDPAFAAIFQTPFYPKTPAVTSDIFREQAFITPLVEMVQPLARQFLPPKGWQARLANWRGSERGSAPIGLFLWPFNAAAVLPSLPALTSAPAPILELVESYYT